jgi:predicted chitinase
MAEPKTKTKTATVSTPPKATVNITVKFKANNAPVIGALGFAVSDTGAVRDLGKTNTAGQLKKVKFEPGPVEIGVIVKNHRGENLPQAFPTNPNSTSIFKGTLNADEVRDFTVLMVQVASQLTITVVDSVSGLPLAGTKFIGASTGNADRNGRFISSGLGIGALHTLSAVHNGFGPEGGNVEGPVSTTLDLRNVTSVVNSAAQIKMKPIFGKVKSSKITVEGKDFPRFYRDFVATFPLMHPTIRISKVAQLSFPAPGNNFSVKGFNDLFDDLPQWAGAAEITIEEFVALFLIFANETGGTFKPIAEKGSLSYMFYLNKGSNERAGDQLLARGIISDPAEVAKWNVEGKVSGNSCSNFPGTSPSGPTDADVTECDFNKFRGRGFVQLTFRGNYKTFLDPSLTAAGLKESAALTNAELDNAVLNNKQVYYGMLGSYLARTKDSWSKANSEQWRQWGLTVAGQGNTGYGDLFQFRAEKLFERLMQAARAGQLDLK